MFNIFFLLLATPISKRFVRNAAGNGTEFIGAEPTGIDDSQFVKCEVEAGTLVLIHGSVVHKSAPNFSDKSRYIYTFHVIEGEAKYPEDNWLQPINGTPFTFI